MNKEVSHEAPSSSSHLPADADDTVDVIRRYLAEKLGFYDGPEKSEKPKVGLICMLPFHNT